MEHKLITGGEIYLPFARSRIKALRAAGLRHASQHYEIDGCSIKVRIEPDHDYITIIGGSVLRMDSGVVDLGVTNETDPARFLPGTLIKSDLVEDYDASFTKAASKAPWWVNPGSGSRGQLSGEVRAAQRITGKIRKDGVAKSFSPKNVVSGDPPVPRPDTADETLLEKKRTADLCPPSMFTGRARLYAQAMFGQYLYDGKITAGQESDNDPPTLAGGSMPALRLGLYEDPDTARREAFREEVAAQRAAAEAAGYGLIFKDPYVVVLNINSGVYFDPTSGGHWLICPSNDEVRIYPLKSSAAGESARKWLKGKKRTELGEEDALHLEAYILSACRPHVEVAVVLPIGPAINAYSMGYGWHWNWSGTRADMVQNLADDEPIVGCISSTHYRLSVDGVYDSETGETKWTASAGTIEGPVVWSTVRPICCITEPTWGNRQTIPDGSPVRWSMKTTSNLSPLFPCDAPFYAFYKKDELQVCRSSATKVAKEDRTVRFSPDYISLGPSGDPLDAYIVEYVTTGPAGGFVEDSSGFSEHWVLTLSCGSSSVTTKYNRIKHSNWTETKNKVYTGLSGTVWAYTGPFVNRYEYGDPKADGTYAYVDLYGYVSFPRFGGYTFNVESRHEAESSFGVAGAIIPFYDAEAAYLIQNTGDELLKNSMQIEEQFASFTQHTRWSDLPPSTATAEYIKNYSNRSMGGGGGPIEYPPDELIQSNLVKTTVMLHRAGGSTMGEVTPQCMSLFDDPALDYVFAEFKTLTSVSFDNPVVRGITPGGAPLGMPGVAVDRPAIVGWT